MDCLIIALPLMVQNTRITFMLTKCIMFRFQYILVYPFTMINKLWLYFIYHYLKLRSFETFYIVTDFNMMCNNLANIMLEKQLGFFILYTKYTFYVFSLLNNKCIIDYYDIFNVHNIQDCTRLMETKNITIYFITYSILIRWRRRVLLFVHNQHKHLF